MRFFFVDFLENHFQENKKDTHSGVFLQFVI